MVIYVPNKSGEPTEDIVIGFRQRPEIGPRTTKVLED